MRYYLANKASSKKFIRKTEKKRLYNQRISSEMKTYLKKARGLSMNNQKEELDSILPTVLKKIDKARQKKVISLNKMSRQKSRLFQLIKKQNISHESQKA